VPAPLRPALGQGAGGTTAVVPETLRYLTHWQRLWPTIPTAAL
jgi:hypothetical protein